MKYFVTGGAGFVGSFLVEKLLARRHNVTVYDNLSSGKYEFIRHHAPKRNFRFIKADLLDLKKLKAAVRGADFVFHLAANPDIRHGIKFTDTDLKQNTLVTFNVLEAMRSARISKIAFSSSSVVYGEAKKLPIPENYGPLMPISLYGASKLACEGLISAYCGTFGFQGWIFRFANLVGPRMTHGIIYDLTEKLRRDKKKLKVLGDGRQKKSYLYVDDCIDAMLLAIRKSRERTNIFNLGSGDWMRVSGIAQALLRLAGLKETKIVYTGGDRGWPGDVPRFLLDVGKLSRLGWKARYNSKEAITKAIEEHLNAGGNTRRRPR